MDRVLTKRLLRLESETLNARGLTKRHIGSHSETLKAKF